MRPELPILRRHDRRLERGRNLIKFNPREPPDFEIDPGFLQDFSMPIVKQAFGRKRVITHLSKPHKGRLGRGMKQQEQEDCP